MRRATFLVWVAAMVLLALARANSAAAGFSITDFHLSSQPDGPATTAFPAGTTEVYAVFNYTDAEDASLVGDADHEIPVQVKLYDPLGQVLFLETKSYRGTGTEVLHITNSGYPFGEGVYVLNMYTGMVAPQAGTDNLYVFQTIEWTVGDATIPDVGSGEVIATVEVPEDSDQTVAGSSTGAVPRALLAIMGSVLILLVGIVGWAIRRLLTAS